MKSAKCQSHILVLIISMFTLFLNSLNAENEFNINDNVFDPNKSISINYNCTCDCVEYDIFGVLEPRHFSVESQNGYCSYLETSNNYTYTICSNRSCMPTLNTNCDDCQLNDLFKYESTINFEGGNICCDRNYKLVFFDEFDSQVLDTNKWATYYFYNDSYGNGVYSGHSSRVHENRGSYFKDENVIPGNGICTLRTKQEIMDFPEVKFNDHSGISHTKVTSGMLMSKMWFQNYHRYEIRCLTPPGNSLWTAFWVFGWSTEIDVFEFIRSNNPEFSLHKWISPVVSTQSGKMNLGNLVGSFHTYAVEHDKFFLRWYIDDQLVYSASHFEHLNNIQAFDCDLSEGTYLRNRSFPECNQPALQVIADPGASPAPDDIENDLSSYPKDFLIDYIRVYERVNNDDPNACNYNITGPSSICKSIDTLQFCVEGGVMNGNSWVLPNGMTMYQNPSITINSKLIFNGIRDTLIYDTIVHENCVKVIVNDYNESATLKYIVPYECRFLNGEYLTKKINRGIPHPVVSYTMNGCTSVNICVNNAKDYTSIWFSEEGIISKSPTKICKTISIDFDSKVPPYYNVFIEVKNECGAYLHSLRLDGRNCVLNPPENQIRFTISPNPASDYFAINIVESIENIELPKIMSGQILNINSGNFVKTFDVGTETVILINTENFQEGEYLLILKDSANQYYTEQILINR